MIEARWRRYPAPGDRALQQVGHDLSACLSYDHLGGSLARRISQLCLGKISQDLRRRFEITDGVRDAALRIALDQVNRSNAAKLARECKLGGCVKR